MPSILVRKKLNGKSYIEVSSNTYGPEELTAFEGEAMIKQLRQAIDEVSRSNRPRYKIGDY